MPHNSAWYSRTRIKLHVKTYALYKNNILIIDSKIIVWCIVNTKFIKTYYNISVNIMSLLNLFASSKRRPELCAQRTKKRFLINGKKDRVCCKNIVVFTINITYNVMLKTSLLYCKPVICKYYKFQMMHQIVSLPFA